MFADDTKIIRPIRPSNADQDKNQLQKDIDEVTNWCNEWHMHLNIAKCKIMRIGKRTNFSGYTIFDTTQNLRQQLQITTLERDLGIFISNDLKPTQQVQKAASKANMVLAMLRNTFVTKDPNLWKRLYMTYVRPHLEYAIAAWSPYTKTDIAFLEKVQKRATRISLSLQGLSYPERLHNLGLTTLKRRRERGDLIRQFKIANRIDQIDWSSDQIIRQARGGNRPKLCKELKPNTSQRANFFTNRIVNPWNKLSDLTVSSSSTNEFKNRVDTDCKGYYSSTH